MSWKVPPKIVVEYIDCQTVVDIDNKSNNRGLHEGSADADWTFLPSKERVMIVPDGIETTSTSSNILETSFISVDIGSNQLTLDGSSASDSSRQGCFDIKSGMLCAAQVLTGIPSLNPQRKNHPAVDATRNPYLDEGFHASVFKKRQFSLSSVIGMVCLTIVTIGLIAVGIAVYVEFVTKPSVMPFQNTFNDSYMCELFLDGCAPRGRSMMDTFNLRNNTIGTSYGSTFKNPINVKLHNGI